MSFLSFNNLSIEEQNEVGFKLSSDGEVNFFATENGQIKATDRIDFGTQESISAFALESNVSRLFAVAGDQGTILLAKPEYEITYPDDQRLIIAAGPCTLHARWRALRASPRGR